MVQVIAAVKARDAKAAASRATWHRYKNEIEDLAFAVPRPIRIVLERVSPPLEARPSDSPIDPGLPVDVDVDVGCVGGTA